MPSATRETVSIILRTKDRPLMLPRALESVLAQTFTDWHVHLVNDGGDPDPVDRLLRDRATAILDRVSVTHNAPGVGQVAALNSALTRARGACFAVLDDDDTWRPTFLDRTVAFLSSPENSHYIGVATHCDFVHERIEDGSIIEIAREPWSQFEKTVDIARMLVGNRLPPVSLLFRRTVPEQIGLFDQALPLLYDWDFNLRALALGDIGTIEDRLAEYRHRRQVTDEAYGNSAPMGGDQVTRLDSALRNRALRAALHADPAAAGRLEPVLRRLEEQTLLLRDMRRDVEDRLARLERHMALVHLVAAWHHKLLRPFQRGFSAIRGMTGRRRG